MMVPTPASKRPWLRRKFSSADSTALRAAKICSSAAARLR
jgi:hypothetical protein